MKAKLKNNKVITGKLADILIKKGKAKKIIKRKPKNELGEDSELPKKPVKKTVKNK